MVPGVRALVCLQLSVVNTPAVISIELIDRHCCGTRRSRFKRCTSNLGGRQIIWFGVSFSSADPVTSPRHEEDLRVKEQGQQAKESWHTRIHRRPTETELHRKVAGKTAQSIIDAALNRYHFFCLGCVHHHTKAKLRNAYLCGSDDELQGVKFTGL